MAATNDAWKVRRATAQNRVRLYKRISVLEWVLNADCDIASSELTLHVKNADGLFERVTFKSVSKECAEALRKSFELELQVCQREAGCNNDLAPASGVISLEDTLKELEAAKPAEE